MYISFKDSYHLGDMTAILFLSLFFSFLLPPYFSYSLPPTPSYSLLLLPPSYSFLLAPTPFHSFLLLFLFPSLPDLVIPPYDLGAWVGGIISIRELALLIISTPEALVDPKLYFIYI